MKKTIGLVAHDNMKPALLTWVGANAAILAKHRLVCTGTTGRMVRQRLTEDALPDPDLTLLKSGPLGGDQQLGALIAEGQIDLLIFLWDPMQPQPHDVDVKALLRLAAVYDLPVASTRSTADFLISSPHFNGPYTTSPLDYQGYIDRLEGASR